jgi:hypothetical protein
MVFRVWGKSIFIRCPGALANTWMPVLQPGLLILSHGSKPVILVRTIGVSLIKEEVSEYDSTVPWKVDREVTEIEKEMESGGR